MRRSSGLTGRHIATGAHTNSVSNLPTRLLGYYFGCLQALDYNSWYLIFNVIHETPLVSPSTRRALPHCALRWCDRLLAYSGRQLHCPLFAVWRLGHRSEEHTSELQSLMRISYAVFCLKKKNTQKEC